MRSRRVLFILAVLAVAALAVAGCGGNDEGTVTTAGSATTLLPDTTESTAATETTQTTVAPVGADVLYAANCAACHGAKGEGASGPALRDRGPQLTEEQIGTQIRKGGGAMPAFEGQLDDEQIQTLTKYVKAGVTGS